MENGRSTVGARNGPDFLLPVTRALQEWGRGSAPAEGPVWSAIYCRLKQLVASARRREGPLCELHTTALAHETILRLSPQGSSPRRGLRWRSREHFYRVAARTVRRLLIDQARRRKAIKRGAGQPLAELPDDQLAPEVDADRLLDLDQALQRLAAHDARCARVVELRFFGGLTDAETAAVLGVSKRTVEDDWRYARTWLKRDLGRAGETGRAHRND